MLAFPRVAEMVNSISPVNACEPVGAMTSVLGVGPGVGEVEGEDVVEGEDAATGVLLLLELEKTTCPPATVAKSNIEIDAKYFHETLFFSVGILVTLFSINMS